MRNIAGDNGTNILVEQFIPDHVFIYLNKGTIRFFDGNKSYVFNPGDACIARKNRLVKYEILNNSNGVEPILFCFDEPFLLQFQQIYQTKKTTGDAADTFCKVQQTEMLKSFIHSIKPYHTGLMQLDEAFEDLKYEELLIILLKQQPGIAAFLFEFGKPGKINLEEFMLKNFKFNVSLQRFAFLTGRSLSSFKRDFAAIFNDTPNHWLIRKRLDEAYYLIETEKQKPNVIYLDLGFEDLSHFSYAFKKTFGITPTSLYQSSRVPGKNK